MDTALFLFLIAQPWHNNTSATQRGILVQGMEHSWTLLAALSTLYSRILLVVVPVVGLIRHNLQ